MIADILFIIYSFLSVEDLLLRINLVNKISNEIVIELMKNKQEKFNNEILSSDKLVDTKHYIFTGFKITYRNLIKYYMKERYVDTDYINNNLSKRGLFLHEKDDCYEIPRYHIGIICGEASSSICLFFKVNNLNIKKTTREKLCKKLYSNKFFFRKIYYKARIYRLGRNYNKKITKNNFISMYMYHVQYKLEPSENFIKRSGLCKQEILNLFLPEINYHTMHSLYNLKEELKSKKKIRKSKYINTFEVISFKTLNNY